MSIKLCLFELHDRRLVAFTFEVNEWQAMSESRAEFVRRGVPKGGHCPVGVMVEHGVGTVESFESDDHAFAVREFVVAAFLKQLSVFT